MVSTGDSAGASHNLRPESGLLLPPGMDGFLALVLIVQGMQEQRALRP